MSQVAIAYSFFGINFSFCQYEELGNLSIDFHWIYYTYFCQSPDFTNPPIAQLEDSYIVDWNLWFNPLLCEPFMFVNSSLPLIDSEYIYCSIELAG